MEVLTIFEHPVYLFVFLMAYLLGSIPFGFLFTLWIEKKDIRKLGSGNIGTTNVLRTGNKKIAGLTLLGDLLKGTLAVVLARYVFQNAPFISFNLSENIYIPFAGFCAFLGHLFPLWLKFKGGKGVATYIGIILALFWPIAVIYGILWFIVAYLTKYSSLAALISSTIIPILVSILYGPYPFFFLALMTIMIFIKHQVNIKNLYEGREHKIGQTKK